MRNIFLLFFLVSLFGCTGTEINVKPEVQSIAGNAVSELGKVGVVKNSGDFNYPPAGNLTDDFVSDLQRRRIAKDVYFPLRPDDKVDLVLDTKFNVRADTHSGSTFAKSFFTGFTFFLIEPIIWYDIDYKLDGSIGLLKDGKLVKTINAQTDATISMKWLSLGSAGQLEAEALLKAKKSLYEQLIRDISVK
jgi:hypothetical protein